MYGYGGEGSFGEGGLLVKEHQGRLHLRQQRHTTSRQCITSYIGLLRTNSLLIVRCKGSPSNSLSLAFSTKHNGNDQNILVEVCRTQAHSLHTLTHPFCLMKKQRLHELSFCFACMKGQIYSVCCTGRKPHAWFA